VLRKAWFIAVVYDGYTKNCKVVLNWYCLYYIWNVTKSRELERKAILLCFLRSIPFVDLLNVMQE
jgi:hypothetical protein